MKRIYYIIIGVIVIVIAVSLIVLQSFTQGQTFKGIVLNPPLNTSDFILYDQNNQTIELNQFYGKVIAMSFIYTNCPDICPTITRYFSQVARTLNSEGYSNDYVMLLISVDPARDAPVAKEWLQKFNSPSNIHFLIGPASTLKQVWQAYGIYVSYGPGYGQPGANYTVDHTAIVLVIDKQLRIRVTFGSPLSPASPWQPNDLLNDMLLLIKE